VVVVVVVNEGAGGRGRRRGHFGHFSMTIFIKDILVHSRQKF